MNGRGILEFVSVQRVDNGQWAIPGGMVEPGDNVSITLKKEFGEEALSSLECTDEEKVAMKKNLNILFKSGSTVFKGYVDDPRNTDNAWMETVAVNVHDASGHCFDHFKLKAGDDAKNVQWTAIIPGLDLYASHANFITTVVLSPLIVLIILIILVFLCIIINFCLLYTSASVFITSKEYNTSE